MKRILVAASPGQLERTTMRAAARLAETNNAKIRVLDVMPPMPKQLRSLRADGRLVDVEAALVRYREEGLRSLVDSASPRWAGDVGVVVGQPSVEVTRHVLAHGYDLVIVGARWTAPAFDDDVTQLLRQCPVPVWVMRPLRAGTLRVLAVVDPDPDDPVRDGLNDHVLELATTVARRGQAELHVGHAWRLKGESMLRSSPYIRLAAETVDRMSDAAESSRRHQLDSLMNRHRLDELGASAHLVPGKPDDVLPALAEQLDIDLVVIGTLARTGLPGLIIGNTAETILRTIRCSVLAVKPHGFVSPVQPDIHKN